VVMYGIFSRSLFLALCASSIAAASWPWPWSGNTTTTHAPSAVHAFEQGVATALGFDDINSCYVESHTGVEELWDAMQHYKHGGYIAKAEALAKFAEGFHTVIRALEPCSQTMTDASEYRTLIKTLMDPRYYTIHNALTLALNLAEDHKRLFSFVDAWDKGDYHTAGSRITSIVLDVLLNPGIPSSSGTEAVQIGMGIASEFASNLPFQCLSDVSVDVPAIVGGIIDIYTVIKAVTGFESLFHGIKGLVPMYKHCLSDRQKIVDLLREMADFRHPAELATKITENVKKAGVDLSLETAQAILAYKGAEWKRVGIEIGKILSKILIISAEMVVV